MPRQADPERLTKINEYVERHPGSRPTEIAKGLEIPRSSVTRALPNLEETGRLLSEDGRGRLWPFHR